MGVTDSTDLIEEHWVDDKSDPLHTDQQEEKQEEQGGDSLEEKLASSSLKNQLDLLQRKEKKHITCSEVEISLNEDELNEEKMWIDAISLEPKSSALRNQLANHYFSQNRLKEAEFAYLSAITLDPLNSIAHYDYAFMRHHEFYWSLAKSDMKSGYKYAMESKEHYSSVLNLDCNDIETHYQLSLLYLTMLETTLIESIDNIDSALISGIYRNIDRGIASPWYCDIEEIHCLCTKHLEITLNSCSSLSAVLFGTYITSSRLLYIECIPNSFIFYSLNKSEKISKLNLAESYLHLALEINDMDATAHHDLALILSHSLIGKYNDAIYHWLCSIEIDSNNAIYSQQIAYIYQYYLKDKQNAIKYYNLSLKKYESVDNNFHLASIWNNLGIMSAQSAKTQNDIIYARKCWNKCLSICSNHCEAHRNLGNILWLHFYDENAAEIHLQRAIAISSQIYNQIQTKKGNDTYYQGLKDKFASFLAQSKSDYGGLLLMMFKYDLLAEKQLNDALEYDENCISANYYLGKYLYDTKKEYNLSVKHLNRYIELELNDKNISNRAHSHQILGEISLKISFKFREAQYHFAEAISLTKSNNNDLPIWAQCKIHCGFADSIIKYELNEIYDCFGSFKSSKTQNIINELRSKYNQNKENSLLKENIETAKKHYRLILKLDNKFVAAPLGLAHIFGKIEGKIKLSEKHYNDSIKICKEKLCKLFEKYQIEIKKQNYDKKLNKIQQKKIKKYYKKKEKEEESSSSSSDCVEEEEIKVNNINNKGFKAEFKLNLEEIDCILNNDSNYDIAVIRIIKEIKEYVLLCIESHLGVIDLIMIECHNNKWKEALAHCNKIIYLNKRNIIANYKKALLQNKLNQKQKAIQTAKYTINLAKQIKNKQKQQFCIKNLQNIIENNE